MKNIFVSLTMLVSLVWLGQANAAQSGLEEGMMEYQCESGDSSNAANRIADWMNRGYDQIYTLPDGIIVGCGMMSKSGEYDYDYGYEDDDETSTSRRRR